MLCAWCGWESNSDIELCQAAKPPNKVGFELQPTWVAERWRAYGKRKSVSFADSTRYLLDAHTDFLTFIHECPLHVVLNYLRWNSPNQQSIYILPPIWESMRGVKLCDSMQLQQLLSSVFCEIVGTYHSIRIDFVFITSHVAWNFRTTSCIGSIFFEAHRHQINTLLRCGVVNSLTVKLWIRTREHPLPLYISTTWVWKKWVYPCIVCIVYTIHTIHPSRLTWNIHDRTIRLGTVLECTGMYTNIVRKTKFHY